MDWFLVTLAITTVVRGFGAGLIWDVALISLQVRKQIGASDYTRYAAANFDIGGKTYAPVALAGALLTVVITIWDILASGQGTVSWWIAASLLATVLAFGGTFVAFPVLQSLRKAPADEVILAKTLDKFAFWHSFSAIWQLLAFVALVIELAVR